MEDSVISADLVRAVFEKQQKRALELRTSTVAQRKEPLKRLRRWVRENRSDIQQVLFKEFRKPPAETDAIEIFHVLDEIRYALSHLDQWASPKEVKTPLTMLGTRSFIQYEPKGVCLIIAPWNYPFTLAMGPLVSALAAGNTAIIKPSEFTPHVSALIRRMATEVFDNDLVAVVEGGPDTAQFLLTLPFDHIFFTGSPNIGKMVMKAAAENLSSVTLELGGKSPAIVTPSASLEEAAERVAVAKFVNSGQTCVAPDYVLVDQSVAERFVSLLIGKIKDRFSEGGDFEKSQSYSRMVNNRHFQRVLGLLQDALQRGARLETGGTSDASSCFIHPTVITGVPLDAQVMQEEIFGPVLPVISYQTLEEAIHIVNQRPKPLSLYIFSRINKDQEKILKETSAGGVCINDCGIHFLNPVLPFGGVNNSGIGKSHGYYGFLAFSNEKPVLKQKTGMTSVKIFYPPYTQRTRKIMDWFLKLF